MTTETPSSPSPHPSPKPPPHGKSRNLSSPGLSPGNSLNKRRALSVKRPSEPGKREIFGDKSHTMDVLDTTAVVHGESRQKSFVYAVEASPKAKSINRHTQLKEAIEIAQSHMRSNTMRENIKKNQEKSKNVGGGIKVQAASYGMIMGAQIDAKEKEMKRMSPEGSPKSNQSRAPQMVEKGRKLLMDKDAMVRRFSQEHIILEPKNPRRDSTRRGSVDALRSPIANPRAPKEGGASPTSTGRVISLKEDGEEEGEESDDPNKPKSKLKANMSKLKKHIKMIGKASLLLNMMKPSMITHKKGAKPPNYDVCKTILAKQPMYRSRKECQQLLMLVKNVKFFQNLETDAQLELCKVMGHKDVAWARDTVMRQGDPGTTFFVILLGSFHVQIKVQDSKNLKTVAHLHPGDSFGEAALISNNPRNATVVSAEPAELLCIEKEDYARVIKKLHVDELTKKINFIRNVPAFKSFPEEVITDLAARAFLEKVPIYSKLWEQNDAVDSMKYMAILRHGEIHVMKNFSLKKKSETKKRSLERRGNISIIPAGLTLDKKIKALATRQGASMDDDVQRNRNQKRACLCILGPNAAFIERSMFTSFSKDRDDAVEDDESKKIQDKIMHENSEARGCTLVTSCACEIAWLSRHIFYELVKLSNTQGEADRRESIYKDAVYNHFGIGSEDDGNDGTTHQRKKKKKVFGDVLAGMKEWIIEYPTENELKQLFKESILWKQYKSKVIKMTKDAITNKRSQGMEEQKKKQKSDEIVSKVRDAKYGAHPLKCDLKLPFRKPVDLLPLSVNTNIKSPEFYNYPDRTLYDHVETDLTPRALTKKHDIRYDSLLAVGSPTHHAAGEECIY